MSTTVRGRSLSRNPVPLLHKIAVGFGVRHRSVWGTAPLSLGYGTAQFGVRHRSVWGTAPLSLGYGFRAGSFPKYLILIALRECAFRLTL